MNQDNTGRRASNEVSDTPPKARILVVDDDKFLLDMYGQKFSGAGFVVETSLSGADALQILRGGFSPDIVIFDITMPELDGFAFLKSITDEHLAPGAIKIALTNQSDEAEKSKAAELGVSRYIVKASMIPSEVVAAVTEALAKRRPAKH